MLIKILDSIDGKYYFKVVAKNGETVATSETYSTKQKCEQTADLIADDDSVEIGDFTRRKKPGPKPKDEYLDFENNGEKKIKSL